MCFNKGIQTKGAMELTAAGGQGSLTASLMQFGAPEQHQELRAPMPFVGAQGPGPAAAPAPKAAPAEAIEEVFSPEAWPEGVTTALLRNIACRFMEEDVCATLDALGFRGHYDSVCVPRSRMMHSNLGYAFVKFSTSEYAKLCCKLCQGKVFGQSQTKKLCEVVPARIQGNVKSKDKGRKTPNQKGAHVPAAATKPFSGTPPQRAQEAFWPVFASPFAGAGTQPFPGAASLPAWEAFAPVHRSPFAGEGTEASAKTPAGTLAVFSF